jgi:hypothetical protein
MQGIVEVPLKAAAAADPMGAAMRPEAGAAQEEAQQRRRAAYQHIFSTLRMLVSLHVLVNLAELLLPITLACHAYTRVMQN